MVMADDDVQTIAQRLQRVRNRIDAACKAAGRKSEEVCLIAVSKTHPIACVQEAMAAGQYSFGENRVQEAAAKFEPLRDAQPPARLHLIGGLQTNKAQAAVRIADVIESIDRQGLADAVARAADREGRLPQLLVQVNTGQESQKSGVAMADADDFIKACHGRFGAALTGLMCIPPASEDPAPHFRILAALARAHGLSVLSMGMSNDFEVAIAEGATHVRVGSAIFGTRPAAEGHRQG